jgi:hypothetical protein
MRGHCIDGRKRKIAEPIETEDRHVTDTLSFRRSVSRPFSAVLG